MNQEEKLAQCIKYDLSGDIINVRQMMIKLLILY